ncbi:MAG: Gfo/Idh/MocA family oxidoreductase [Sebaldella sp.]|nr:Gfo/Idh/MocA family oxidoreductase [Sebaldella sp.]
MVRFGIVGTNWITEKLINAGSMCEDFQLNAVYSRTEEKGREFAEKYKVENIYTDLLEMAKSGMIDAVYIASPNSFHYEQSKLFLENKIAVLCEKPLSSNSFETNDLIKTAKENNTLLMEAMKIPHVPNYRSVFENLYKIGKVRRFIGSYCQYSSRYDKYKTGEYTNTFDPKFSNGSLLDIGVYPLYAIVSMFGRPNNIKASGVLLESGVDGEGSMILEYNDMQANVIFSKITDSYNPSEIQGEQGSILINHISEIREAKIIYRDGTEEILSEVQEDNTMYYELSHFIDLCKAGEVESPVNNFELTKIVSELMESARKEMGVVYPADSKY